MKYYATSLIDPAMVDDEEAMKTAYLICLRRLVGQMTTEHIMQMCDLVIQEDGDKVRVTLITKQTFTDEPI